MRYPFQIKQEDCSLLGQAIFKHLETHQISMRELARQANVTQPGLRAACLKGGNPTKSTLQRLSPVLDIPLSELQWMVRENRLRNEYEPDLVDFILIGIATILKALKAIAEKMPDDNRLSPDELVDMAFDSAENTKSPRS
jgi:transcriptional regulator with XRE-family HTH domain